MSYTVSDIKTDLTGVIHGTSINKISGIYAVINRAARTVLLDVDPQETKRTALIANALYDQVYDYAAPTDLKGNRVTDVRPQANRTMADNFTQSYGKEFDLRKSSATYQVRFNRGVKTIRISQSETAGILISEANSTTENGTWSASGVATNLLTDTINYVSGSGSLKFSTSGAGAATLTNSTLSAVDLSSHQNYGSIFMWVDFGTSQASVTNVILRWGDDASNYWTATATTTHWGSSFQSGWNLVRFDWSSATTVGAPVSSSVNYVLATVTVTGAVNNFHIDNIISKLGTPFEAEYYSRYIFTDGTSGEWKENATNDADIINLATESYNLLFTKTAELVAQQLQDIGMDVKYQGDSYKEILARYKGIYKSEADKPREMYYRMK